MHNLRNEPSYIVQYNHTFEKKKKDKYNGSILCSTAHEVFFSWLLQSVIPSQAKKTLFLSV